LQGVSTSYIDPLTSLNLGKFFIVLILASLGIAALTIWGASQGLFDKPTYFKATLILLVVMTGLIYVYLYRADKPEFFLNLYLLTMVVKVAAYCAYNLVIIMRDRQAAVTNVGFFMVTYFIFTGIEIAFLHRKITRENKP
jgi:hypothetical protein